MNVTVPHSGNIVESVLRACELLRAWRYEGELLRLRDIATRVPLSKTTAQWLLQSLCTGGLIERVGLEQYRSLVRRLSTRLRRIGFGGERRRVSTARGHVRETERLHMFAAVLCPALLAFSRCAE